MKCLSVFKHINYFIYLDMYQLGDNQNTLANLLIMGYDKAQIIFCLYYLITQGKPVEERLDIHNSNIPKLCRSCEVRHKGICGTLTATELLEISKHTRQITHEAGVELISDGEPITSYATIMHGVVKLSKILEDGRQQVVGLQFSPDFIGRLFSQTNNYRAEAASDVQICQMPKKAIENLIKANPELEHSLLEQTLKELDEAREWMVTLGRKSALEKVACFLYLIATHFDPAYFSEQEKKQVNIIFDLPLTRADIADFLGLTVETVSRQFTKLRTEKLIEITARRHVLIPNLDKLKQACG